MRKGLKIVAASSSQATLFDALLPVAPSLGVKLPVKETEGPEVLSVGSLTRRLKSTIEGQFWRVWVRGEVSNYRGPNARGHLYFALKDAEACIDAKIWASAASKLKFKLRDGLAVVVEGSVDLYEPHGRYSLIVQRIEPEGEGALALAFQQLKEKLIGEGLMGDHRSRPIRPIPLLPRRIGVVTSRTGAAFQDFLRIVFQRHPRMSVLLCDARVQGEGSAPEIVRALKRLSSTDVDVIVVTRGGGSVEDLWAFNEETVARAIFDCPVPVVSAVGHEVDFTIADFVADHRCSTPSAAAEKLAPVLSELEVTLATGRIRLRKAAERHLMHLRHQLQSARLRLADPHRLLSHRQMALSASTDRMVKTLQGQMRVRRDAYRSQVARLTAQNPNARLHADRRNLSLLKEQLKAAMLKRFSQSGRTFHSLEARLGVLSPLHVMGRGYAVVFKTANGQLVRKGSDVEPGDAISIRTAGFGCTTLSECEEIDAVVRRVMRPNGDAK